MLARALKRTRDGLVALFYPQDCHLCGASVESLDDGVCCDRCWRDEKITRVIASPFCFKCGLPLPHITTFSNPRDSASNERQAAATAQSRWCGKCHDLPFHAARSAGLYSGAIEASILFLKSRPHVCRRLREIMFATFLSHREALQSDIVLPVPLHRARERERGFNQATVIARLFARRFNIGLEERLLARVKYTDMHRAGLDEVDRAKSVRRAFKVRKPEVVNGASVLLVDDLYTTGSTVSACAGALIDAGARRVAVLTLARVVPGVRKA